MTEDTAIKIMIDHLKGLFPRACPDCHRNFGSLREFYLQTRPAGNPVILDLEANDLRPEHPRGAVAISHCKCGASMELRSDGMPLFQYWALLLWARSETRRRSLTTAELLSHLRIEVRKRVIAETAD